MTAEVKRAMMVSHYKTEVGEAEKAPKAEPDLHRWLSKPFHTKFPYLSNGKKFPFPETILQGSKSNSCGARLERVC